MAVASAVGLLLSKNAIYAALNLIMNFVTVAIFYLMLAAPFIALLQVTVYAGAIMVLFLFVIMLLGAERLSTGSALPWQRPAGFRPGRDSAVRSRLRDRFPLGDSSSSRGATGRLWHPRRDRQPALQHLLAAFEVISILLLAAMVGAIVLTKQTETKCANPDVTMLPYYIGLSALLFTLGALGVLIRRNAIIIFMSIELMLNSANLAFVAFARRCQLDEWADFCLLRDGGGSGGSGGWPGADRGDFPLQAQHRY